MRLIDRACEVDALLLYPACILKDVFHLIDNEGKRLARLKKGEPSKADILSARTYAWGCIEAIQELALPTDTTLIDIRMASMWRNVNGDFEDNLIRAAAQRCEADLVVAWDKGLLSSPAPFTPPHHSQRLQVAHQHGRLPDTFASRPLPSPRQHSSYYFV